MAEGVQCAYLVEGKGPPLLMVHGISGRKEGWRGVIDELKDDFTCIALDLRGHGQSPVTPTPFGLDELIADVESVRQRSGFEKVHIIGHSLGGMIAPGYARAYPDKVGAIGLLATSAFRPPETRAAIMEMSHILKEKGMAALIDNWIPIWFTDEFAAANPDVVATRKKQALATDGESFRMVFEIFNLSEMSPWLHEVKAPALVLPAEHDNGCSPAINRRIAEAMPNATFDVLDGLRHSILLEAPKRVAARVREFLLAHPLGKPATS
jgi:3-oxoadipate enol-lactonase